MNAWHPGDRVEQASYGHGTVLEATDQHVVVHFDRHGRRRFAANLAVLKASTHPAPAASTGTSRPSIAPGSRVTTTDRPTDAGYQNAHQQKVIRVTSVSGQRVYVLLCGKCHVQYGTDGAQIEERRCPYCMGGESALNFKA